MEGNLNNQESQEADVGSQEEIKDIWQRFILFLKELLDIRQGADPKSTIEGIKKDIPFKGHTAWILVFSIFIASIGLNTNSAAVVIGAMLISPLMGPILGIGLSIGINDIDTLRRSLVNFGVMVLLSVLTAFIYFKISPFQIPSSEIISRTEPTLLDVLIAVFGGLAGIVAGSRKEKSNAIPGVAIATALMPPLCTAGFGLATANWDFFFGALYLFGINTVFIALSTFVVVKYLRFPLAKYATADKRKKVNRIVLVVALVVIIPSVVSFIRIIDRNLYENQAQIFINDNFKVEGSEVIKTNVDCEKKIIEAYFVGDIVPEQVISIWQSIISENSELEGTQLKVKQGQDKISELRSEMSQVKDGFIKDLFNQNNSFGSSDKDAEIRLLKDQIKQLNKKVSNEFVPLDNLASEAKINYPGLKGLTYFKRINYNFKKLDTMPVFTVKWGEKMDVKTISGQQKKLGEWLKFKLKLDNLLIESE